MCPKLSGIACAEAPSVGSSAFAHGRNRVTMQLLGRAEVSPLLDYGCGRAEFAIAAGSELGLTVHACDIDADLIARLSDSHGEAVNFFTVAERDPELPFADGELAAVSCCDVLEHIPAEQRIAVLRELRRVLADDGMLVVTTPHKGLFSAADPENAKYHLPAIHRLIFRRVKSAEKFRLRYEGERYGNYSAGARRHLHFSSPELAEMLGRAGFEVQETSYFTLFRPLIRTVLWLAEGLDGRVPGARALKRVCWKLYIWDADLNPGKLAFCIAMRAKPARQTPVASTG